MSLTRATIPVFVPFVNCPDMLKRCLDSLSIRLTTEPVVINNSGEGMPAEFHHYTIITPGRQITFSQTQNSMLELAVKTRNPFYFFMHSDAEDNEGILDKLFDMAMLQRDKWGAIFTNYDALACFNTEAMQAIGGWDEGFEWYHSDADTYRRLRLAGYPALQSNLHVRHDPSQTLKSDPRIARKVNAGFAARCDRYRAKWGGGIGSEVYEVPFDGKASS
jgi:hypothetical protein